MITKQHLLVCVNSVVSVEDRQAWIDYVNSTYGTELTLDLFGNATYFKNNVQWDVSCFWNSQTSDKFTDESIAELEKMFDPNLILCGVTDDAIGWLTDNGLGVQE